jgi:hypothetical protein
MEAHLPNMRKVPIRVDPGEGIADAIWLENEPLILDDRDIEVLWKTGRVICRVDKVPAGLKKHAFVHVISQSGKPIRRLIKRGRTEYDLGAFIPETPRVLEFDGKKSIEITVESPAASIIQPSKPKAKKGPGQATDSKQSHHAR